jgi:hypothetical protein
LHHNFLLFHHVKKAVKFIRVYVKNHHIPQSGDVHGTEVSFVHPEKYERTTERRNERTIERWGDLSEQRTTKATMRADNPAAAGARGEGGNYPTKSQFKYAPRTFYP